MLGLRPSRVLPRSSSVAFALGVAAATLSLAPAARADLLPQNDCTDPESPDASPRSLGQSCTTAGPNFDEDGICANATYPCGAGPGREAGTCSAVLCELPVVLPADSGAPSDHCADGAATGSACTNGGPSFDQAGTCQPAHCDCSICVVSEDASTPTKDAGSSVKDATAPKKDAGKVTAPKDATTAGDASTQLESSSGCSVASSHDAGTGWDGAWFLGLAAVGLTVSASRRRRA